MRMSKNVKKGIEPRLRFPQFKRAGDWNASKLGEVSTIRSGSTPLRANIEFFENGNIPWVKTTDLNNSFIFDSEEKITAKANARVNEVGSILVAMYGGFNQIGRTGYLKVPAATNQALSVLRCDITKVEPIYLLMWLNGNVEYWKKFASSSRKDPNITGSDVAKFPIIYPKIAEQVKIADCLLSLDEVITAQGEKVEALKTYKKGLLQQLFPQEGQTTPTLRFPEFKKAGDWLKVSLGDCLKEKPSYGANASAIPYNSKLPRYIRITDIDENSNLRNDDPVSIEANEASDYILNDGDFLIARSGNTVGKSLLFKASMGNCAHAGYLLKFKFDPDKTTSSFFQFVAQSDFYWSWVKASLRAGGQPNINAQEYSAFEFMIPAVKKEQQKIADCLSSLDELIAKQNENLESLKLHKKGLLQQLFPSLTEAADE